MEDQMKKYREEYREMADKPSIADLLDENSGEELTAEDIVLDDPEDIKKYAEKVHAIFKK